MRTLTIDEHRQVRGGQTAGSSGTPGTTTTTSTSTTTTSFNVGATAGADGSLGFRVSYSWSEGGSPAGSSQTQTGTNRPNDGIVHMEVEEVNRPAAKQAQQDIPEDLEGLF